MSEARASESISYAFAPTRQPSAPVAAESDTVPLAVDIPADLHAQLVELEQLDHLSLARQVEAALTQYVAHKERSPLIVAARARATKAAERRETISGRIPAHTRARAREHASRQGVELQQLLGTALTEYLDRHEG